METGRNISPQWHREPQEQAAPPRTLDQGFLQGKQTHSAHAGAQQVQLQETGSTSSPAMTRPLQMSQSWSSAVSGSIFPAAAPWTTLLPLWCCSSTNPGSHLQVLAWNCSWSQDARCQSAHQITQSGLDGSQKQFTTLNKPPEQYSEQESTATSKLWAASLLLP